MTDISKFTEQDIREMPTTGEQGRTPRNEIEGPATDRELEVVWITDVSGSNQEFADSEGTIRKVDLVCDAAPVFIAAIESDDAQAAEEQSGGSDELGGARTLAFSEESEFTGWDEEEAEFKDPRDLGDINSSNRERKVAEIRRLVARGYSTHIMPAIRAAEKCYQAEFGNTNSPHYKPLRSRPAIEMLITTDGELSDRAEFEAWLQASADETCVVAVAVYGVGPDHDRAVASWKKIAEKSKYIQVISLTGVSNAEEMALDLRLMSGTAPRS